MNKEPDYVIRMREEYADLGEKITKAVAFLYGDGGLKLDETNKNLLKNQIHAMWMYSEALARRIKQFEDDQKSAEVRERTRFYE